MTHLPTGEGLSSFVDRWCGHDVDARLSERVAASGRVHSEETGLTDDDLKEVAVA